jgi:predicted transcriptional regulator
MITSVQVRMARGALGISTAALAKMAKVVRSTVTRFENDEGRFLVETVTAIQTVLEKKGIIFLAADEVKPGGPGVRMKKGRAGAGHSVAIEPVQLRMARAAFNLKANELADEVGLTSKTILRFERGESDMQSENMARVRALFEKRGIIFLAEHEVLAGGPGIRFKKKS